MEIPGRVCLLCLMLQIFLLFSIFCCFIVYFQPGYVHAVDKVDCTLYSRLGNALYRAVFVCTVHRSKRFSKSKKSIMVPGLAKC